jgi:hypothetical protein
MGALGREGRRLTLQLKIEDAVLAYMASGFAATALVAIPWCGLILANASLRPTNQVDLASFIVGGTFTWIAISIAGLLVAWPFVTLSTFVGKRFAMESLLYYAASGGITMALLVFLVFGVPRATSFGSVMAAWLIAPPCGASWGGCWWLIHRRWKIGRPPDAGIFA